MQWSAAHVDRSVERLVANVIDLATQIQYFRWA